MKTTEPPEETSKPILEIVISVFAVTMIIGLLIFNYFIYKEPEESQIFDLPKESGLLENQPTKYKRFDVRVKLTKYQLQKMLELVEEKNAYYNEDGSFTSALPQDSMIFRSVAKGINGEYEISSTQLSRYTGRKRVEESILNE